MNNIILFIMTNLISDCILKNDLARLGFKLLIRNETSHTIITKSELILLKELRDDGLTLDVPINICQKGHNLTLFFLRFDSAPVSNVPDFGTLKEAQFEALAKVEMIEKNETKDGSVFIDVQFTQYNIEGWKKVVNQYLKNQEEINSLIMGQHLIRDNE